MNQIVRDTGSRVLCALNATSDGVEVFGDIKIPVNCLLTVVSSSLTIYQIITITFVILWPTKCY